MSKYADDDYVRVGYGSRRNIRFHGVDNLGVTWGEWREMDEDGKNQVLTEYIAHLVDVWIDEDED
jgi:hypothetical protein